MKGWKIVCKFAETGIEFPIGFVLKRNGDDLYEY